MDIVSSDETPSPYLELLLIVTVVCEEFVSAYRNVATKIVVAPIVMLARARPGCARLRAT